MALHKQTAESSGVARTMSEMSFPSPPTPVCFPGTYGKVCVL